METQKAKIRPQLQKWSALGLLQIMALFTPVCSSYLNFTNSKRRNSPEEKEM